MTDIAARPDAATQPEGEAPWENMFGVCAALGADFGFNPLWLRIAFGAGLIFQPIGVIAGYVALGLIVLASRLIAPDRKRAKPAAAVTALPARAAQDERVEQPALPLAA